MSLRRRNLQRFGQRTRKLRAIDRVPFWAELQEIRQFYIDCPQNMVVDHVIPTKGKNVSGLHVLNNLQYLTPEENNFKKNYFGDFQKGSWKEYEKEYMRQYQQNNRERIREQARDYRERNREHVRAYHREYQKMLRKNPEYRKLISDRAKVKRKEALP